MPAEAFSALREAAKARERAEAAYRVAVAEAAAEHGYAAVGRELGVSRQAVRELAMRVGVDVGRDRAVARLAELDARWDALVQWRAKGYELKTAAAITAGRNARAKKLAKRGIRLPTVREEALALAESELLRLVREGFEVDGFDSEVIASELQEAEALRARLEAGDDGIPF